MKIIRYIFTILILLFLVSQSLFALDGGTGKITGRIIDPATGEGLPDANILILGTVLGAATDGEGYYTILNVPPGVYTMQISYVGYQTTTIENITVNTDLTTTINHSLKEETLEGEVIVITAEKPLIKKDLTASTMIMQSEEIQALPITEIEEAVALQAGYVNGHMRGGRSGEVAYMIDGMPVTDSYNGGSIVSVNKDMVEELQVISGAFNAEYGKAMSGIINVTTKRGSDKFGGSFTSYIGDHVSNHTDIFPYIDHVKPYETRNFEGNFYGPLIKDKLFFNVNTRYIKFTGANYGQRRFNPGTVINTDLGELYILGTDYSKDSTLVYMDLPDEKKLDPDTLNHYISRLRENHKDGEGDGEWISINHNRKLYMQAKLQYRHSPTLDMSLTSILDDMKIKQYRNNGIMKYVPDGIADEYNRGLINIFRLTKTLSSRAFFNIGGTYTFKKEKFYLYENLFDPRYVHPYVGIPLPYSFQTGGTENTNAWRTTNTFLGKLDFTAQVTKTHLVKAGLEYQQHDWDIDFISLTPMEEQTDINLLYDSPYINTRALDVSTVYRTTAGGKPYEFSGYIQDKMEFSEFIINIGLRFDYFEPDGKILSDPSDPNIYSPIRPENRYKDLNENGVQDEGEPDVLFAERQEYWYKDSKSKFQVSPRIGAAFPFTDQTKIYFSYGHFFQMPRLELLYSNPNFQLGSGTGNVGVIGNSDLKAEKTVSGEVGIHHMITEDMGFEITGYFRDVRELTGTRSEEILLFGGSARYSKYVNSDFGFIKGIIIAFDKRFSGGWTAGADYTMQIAKGTNSDPSGARNAVAGGALPEIQMTGLNWDQRQTLNLSVSYAGKGWGGSMISQFGSGMPYTPRRSEDITALLINSQIKPATYTVDLRLYKDFNWKNYKATVFLRAFNLFDRLNEYGVFDDTGKAGETTDLQRAQSQNISEYVNTLEDFYIIPGFYGEPRRIELGMTLSFK